MFDKLAEIGTRPGPYEYYTAADLWTDDYISQKMLEYHLDKSVDAASRNHAFIDRSVEWIIRRFNLKPGSRVIDLGCGPGLYTSRFAQCGAEVTGVDFSKRSLDHARKEAEANNLKITYVHANYLDYNPDDAFDLITMIMCDFCALSNAQRNVLLSRFHAMLKPGGSILLDVYSTEFFKSVEERSVYELNHMNGFWSPDDYYAFINTFKYPEENLVLDKYVICSRSGIKTIYNWFQCFDRESIERLFGANDLMIAEFHSNVAGDVFDADSKEFAIVAGK